MESKNLIEDITSFINSSVGNVEIDEEYYLIENEYKRIFGHGVPREMIPNNINMSRIKDAMKQCINNNKDELYGILDIDIIDGALY